LQQVFNLIITPFFTGFVGYFTNYLAIKMLFRPHKRKWYSFGWQGVIPRNRDKLAREIGKLVGNELIQEKDILKSIKNDHFQSILRDFIRKEIKKNLDRDIYLGDILDKIGIDSRDTIKSFLQKIQKDNYINDILNNFLIKTFSTLIDTFMNHKLGDIDLNKDDICHNLSRNIIEKGQWQQNVINELKVKLYDSLYSGKSLVDILPEQVIKKADDLSPVIAEKFIHCLRQILNDPTIKIKITTKLINWKNSYFSSSFFDQIKLGVLNIFLHEDKIAELVENELPKIVNAIVEDKITLENIKTSIKTQINSIVNKPLHHYVEFFGIDNTHALINSISVSLGNYLKSEKFSKLIFDFLIKSMEKNRDLTFKEILNSTGIDIKQLFNNLVSLEIVLSDLDSVATFINSIIKKINLTSTLKGINEETYDKLSNSIQNEINIILDRNIPEIVRNLNIPNIVEERIKSLNIYQLEGLLFSFMADQFQWINILGFILGFIFGMIQSILILIYGG